LEGLVLFSSTGEHSSNQAGTSCNCLVSKSIE
jgi:hypothetical protein